MSAILTALTYLDRSEQFKKHVAECADMQLGISNDITYARASICKSVIGLHAEAKELQDLCALVFSKSTWSVYDYDDILSEFGDLCFWVRQCITDTETLGYYLTYDDSTFCDFYMYLKNKVDLGQLDGTASELNYASVEDFDYVQHISIAFDAAEKIARPKHLINAAWVNDYCQDVYSVLSMAVGISATQIVQMAEIQSPPDIHKTAFSSANNLVKAVMVGNIAKLHTRYIMKDFEKIDEFLAS